MAWCGVCFKQRAVTEFLVTEKEIVTNIRNRCAGSVQLIKALGNRLSQNCEERAVLRSALSLRG
jgi:hypothetical protein